MHLEIESYKGKYRVDFVSSLPIPQRDTFVIIDKIVYDLFYKDTEIDVLTVDLKEENKIVDKAIDIISILISKGFKKNDTICCIGGGVVQDVVSFASSILYRGVKWQFFPTTLLAQCDSCIGSKTSINYKKFKNLLGSFHPPCLVKIFPDFAKTLCSANIKSGIGEMLHYFILDHDLDTAEKISGYPKTIENIDFYILKSLSIKKKIIELDEFDQKERNLFNYGHTFGHAVESLVGYRINHGQAVTIGMEIANRLSLKNSMISTDLYKRIRNILAKNVPPISIDDHESYIECLRKDKKNVNDNLTCILLTEDGATKTQVSYNDVMDVLSHLSPLLNTGKIV